MFVEKNIFIRSYADISTNIFIILYTFYYFKSIILSHNYWFDMFIQEDAVHTVVISSLSSYLSKCFNDGIMQHSPT